MKEIHVSQISQAIEELSIRSNYDLPEDVVASIAEAARKEESDLGREIFQLLQENASLARTKRTAICQDTGVAVVFLEVGQEVRIVGGSLTEAVNEGIRRGYAHGYLRKSVVGDPLLRKNTGDNTPAVLHTEIVPGDDLRIILAPKGAGSENMSALKMLTPAVGAEGVKKFIIDTVDKAGGNPCPPIIVGVGIGGTMEQAALIAKKALLRPVGQRSPLEHVARLEEETLEAINKLGIGPQGLGGSVTALAVHIETYTTHIACLPVAVNIQCHVARHAEKRL
ncbi:MAG: fumarate hydratase [Firmicutes bacterium]|nr:fumarate hydratase [Bacillota bacterium]